MAYVFASEAAAKAAQDKGLSLEQLAPGSGTGGNVTKADVESSDAEPTLVPGAAAVEAAAPSADRAPGTGSPGPADMQLGGSPNEDPAGYHPKADGEASALPDRYHLEECPQDPERTESYSVVRPPLKDASGMVLEPATRVPVTRCVDCGGQKVG